MATRNKRRKATKIQHEKRILECVKKVVEGNLGYIAYEEYAKKKYSISHTATNEIWKEAWIRIKAKSTTDVESKVDLMLSKLDAIEAEAITNNDRKIWLETTKYRGKIYGVEDNKVNVVIDHKIKFDFGDEPEDDENEANEE